MGGLTTTNGPWPEDEAWDVVVVGGGNAGLVTALSARHSAERVLVLERAPEWIRGGNSRHTRNIRCAHEDGVAYNSGGYPEEELLEDLVRVGGGHASMDLARMAVRESRSVVPWMTEHGVRWQQPLKGTLHLSRTNTFFLGGGKALVNTYYQTAQRMRIAIAYDASVEGFQFGDSRVEAIVVDQAGERYTVRAKAVVLASGGFEANLEWLKEYWGDAADNYVVRGTPYNDGRVLRALLNAGAKAVGDPRGFHAVAVDARGPKYDGGIVTRLDSLPFGIVVNKHAQRFYDEGEEIWPKRYAIWGGLIARQEDQIAYSIFDSRMLDKFITSLYKPYQAPTIGELAGKLGLDASALEATVATFNAAAPRDRTFNPGVLDECGTTGLEPAKSHWAVPIEEPPFYGYALRPGITFTYRGLEVDEAMRVQMESGPPMKNLFAAGEIMSGNILLRGYLAGFGLTIGTVSGRIAGKEAARHAIG